MLLRRVVEPRVLQGEVDSAGIFCRACGAIRVHAIHCVIMNYVRCLLANGMRLFWSATVRWCMLCELFDTGFAGRDDISDLF